MDGKFSRLLLVCLALVVLAFPGCNTMRGIKADWKAGVSRVQSYFRR